MKQILIISSLLSILLITSCTSKKKIVINSLTKAEMSAAETVRNVRSNFLTFERLNTSADLNVQVPMFSGNVSTKIRMIKDSVIWLSASKFMFEVGRVLITKDSVFVVERIQKTYIKESFEGISKMAGISLSYQFLEDFLIGNPYLHETNNPVSYFSQDSFDIRPELESLKVRHVFSNKDYSLLETTIVDDKSKMTAEATFEDYRPINADQIFSYFRDISLDNGVDEETALSIKFSNPEIDVEKTISFSIPSSYSPRKL